MCGIAGIVDYNSPIDRSTLERMRTALHHRGPDEQTLRRLPHLGLVHTRLALIDLKNGSQPMCSADGRYWIIYNGEVYNFRELRRELQHFWDFRTDCDTEVVLAAWARWGMECLKRLNGMFAFFCWDARKGQGWLVRDLLGIKPVAWTDKGNFRFASEARALVATQGGAVRGDKLSILEYFVSPYASGVDHSMFAGIHYLEPGQYLHISRSGVTSGFWGDYNPHPQQLSQSPDLHPLLKAAVKRSMIADVPVGYLLSGGLDSTLVTYLGYRHTGRGNAYTIDNHDRDRFSRDKASLWAVADDVPHAVRAARSFRVPHYLVPIDRTRNSDHIAQIAAVNESIPVLEEEFPLHQLYQRAARDQKTIVVGEVADETHLRVFLSLESTDIERNEKYHGYPLLQRHDTKQ
uniref:asparagine synthase (glutamine-hydrolyzing) n=1 Tax=Candidatus Kentrum sp. FW TaxID=2126338 RepID=A0A450RYM4_9GAMM|nr:MAG: asparagine synthase (glutamine-hydrolysing) [Candidatus Kentron sp. FW]